MQNRARVTRTRVRSSRAIAADQRLLVLEPPAGFMRAHQHPGQHCQVGLPAGKRGTFALMSTPAEAALRFLIKEAGLGAKLAALAPGAEVEVSRPGGPGFDLARASSRDLVFVATGTGIAPIRAAVETERERRGGLRSSTLYYGVRGTGHVAIGPELERWRAAGMRVRLCLSKKAGGRYVQHAVAEDRPDVGRCAFVVAGHAAMVEAIRGWVRSHGGSEGWVLGNL